MVHAAPAPSAAILAAASGAVLAQPRIPFADAVGDGRGGWFGAAGATIVPAYDLRRRRWTTWTPILARLVSVGTIAPSAGRVLVGGSFTATADAGARRAQPYRRADNARMRPTWRLLAAAVSVVAAAAPAAAVRAAVPPDAAGPAVSAVQAVVVGDSLTVGVASELPPLLPGVRLLVDARVGRKTLRGLRIALAQAPLPPVVVFLLGTNDPPTSPALLASLQLFERLLPRDGCLVTATISRPPVHGVGYGRLDEALRALREADSRVRVVDWAAMVQANGWWLASDPLHVHPVAAGYAARADAIAAAIRSCPAGSLESSAPQPRARGKASRPG